MTYTRNNQLCWLAGSVHLLAILLTLTFMNARKSFTVGMRNGFWVVCFGQFLFKLLIPAEVRKIAACKNFARVKNFKTAFEI